MYDGRFIFSQLMDFLPRHQFNRCVAQYQGNYRARTFSCYDQWLCMAFAQLTYRSSLRDSIICLEVLSPKLYHVGIRGSVSRSTLAEANEKRDWRIYADLAQVLIAEAKTLYVNEDFGVELDNTVYALDSSTIDLCLATFPWAKFRQAKGAIKLHTLLNLRGNIPEFIHLSDGKLHDVNVLDILLPDPGSIYVMDRGYVDFKRLYSLHQALAFFITRAKSNFKFQRRYSHPVDKSTGVLCDQTIILTGINSRNDYPEAMRRIVYRDLETNKRYVFITNNFSLSALSIAKLYKARWQVELFFKWIKQHLRIKTFFGTSENATKTQIWCAVCVYVLIAIIKKKLQIPQSLYTILQILSVSLFEKTLITQAFSKNDDDPKNDNSTKQLNLLGF
jgi:hypothetical protein